MDPTATSVTAAQAVSWLRQMEQPLKARSASPMVSLFITTASPCAGSERVPSAPRSRSQPSRGRASREHLHAEVRGAEVDRDHFLATRAHEALEVRDDSVGHAIQGVLELDDSGVCEFVHLTLHAPVRERGGIIQESLLASTSNLVMRVRKKRPRRAASFPRFYVYLRSRGPTPTCSQRSRTSSTVAISGMHHALSWPLTMLKMCCC